MEENKELTVLEGTVDSVVFRNEENGYTVLRLTVGEGEPVTVVGCMPGAAPGEGLSVQGSWGRHASYGEQFKAEIVERRVPVGEKAILEYLSSGAVKGVGSSTARRLVEEFGADTFTVLEEHPEYLTRIKGITRKRALQIGDAFRLQMGMRLLLAFLGEHGLPLQLGMPLYRRYGNQALDVLQDNPYLLVDEELGVSFSTADQLALDLGTAGEDPQRVEAGLLFELRHNLMNGHTFLPARKLAWATGQLLGLEDGLPLTEALDALTERGEIVRETVAGEDACYLAQMQEAEAYVAFRLTEFCQRELLPPEGLTGIIDRIEAAQGIQYAPQQREAVGMAAWRQVMLLTGGPGTGKTTCLRGVLALFDHLGLETALCAPTGRAAKRLSEACGTEAATSTACWRPSSTSTRGSWSLPTARTSPWPWTPSSWTRPPWWTSPSCGPCWPPCGGTAASSWWGTRISFPPWGRGICSPICCAAARCPRCASPRSSARPPKAPSS